MTPTLQTIPLSRITCSHSNPRSDPGANLDGLAASIGTEAEPTMVQPPVLEQTGENQGALVIAGERRILADAPGRVAVHPLRRPPRLDPQCRPHTLRLAREPPPP